MFHLAHISDIHLSPLPKLRLRQLANKRITGYVNWRRNRENNLAGSVLDIVTSHLKANEPDHVAITGDLVNLALPKEFDNARAFLEALGNPEEVTAICGNHDAYVRGALQMAIKRWRPYISGDGKDTLRPIDFPFLRIRNEIALIGCNSAVPTLPFMASGRFGKDQAKALAQTLDETREKCRVVMIHHPPVHRATKHYKRLNGIDRFQSVIKENGAELILHGHTHLATTHFIEGSESKVPVIGVTAAGQGLGGHKPPARYNLFSISRKNKEWSIRHQAFGLAQSNAIQLLADETLP